MVRVFPAFRAAGFAFPRRHFKLPRSAFTPIDECVALRGDGFRQ